MPRAARIPRSDRGDVFPPTARALDVACCVTTVSSGAPLKSEQGLESLDRLRDEGRIEASQYEAVYHQAKRSGEHPLDLLVDLGMLSEAELLKAVAHLYETRFVSTERLAKAAVDRQALALVPRALCERYLACPIVFEPRAQSLSVVTPDLAGDVAESLRVAAGVREVRAYVARPAAIVAAIRKHYGGEARAFERLAAERGGSLSIQDEPSGPTFELGGGFEPKAVARPVARAPRPNPRGGASAGPLARAGGLVLGRFDARGGSVEDETAPTSRTEKDTSRYIEMVKILVSLLEQGRAELRGHSAHVASIATKIAERLSVSEVERDAIAVAAYLHDVGKTESAYHLTALNVSRFEGHRIQAQKSFDAPLKLFEAAQLDPSTKAILSSLYERWDGKGFPKGIEGASIPLGARILAFTETYCDLTANPKNPYRRTLTSREAVQVVAQLTGQLFDPSLVDPLRVVVGSDRNTGAGVRPRILLVEPETEVAMALEIHLQEDGYDVTVVRTRPEAEGKLGSERFDIVITEVDLEGGDGFGLVQVAGSQERNRGAAFVFHTRRSDAEAVSRGYELGAADYLTKPTAAALVVAKVGQIFEALLRRRSGGGLSGSLRDMGLTEVMQVLGQSRKSGCLRVVSSHRVGEVFFAEGVVVHASFAQATGEEAVYQLLLLTDGDFKFDPSAKPKERTMQANIESLLLEAMRRMDEAGL